MIVAVTGTKTCSRTDVLALMAETARALSDAETAGLAKIVLPRIAGRSAGQFVQRFVLGSAIAEGLRVGKGRGLFQRKANLRIIGIVDAATLLARAAVGDDVAARAVAEIRRRGQRSLDDLGRNIRARPRGLAAGDAQRLQETLGYGIGLAAG